MTTTSTIIRADDMYEADHGWLKTGHLFSFASYYDPENTHFGNLRVFNDDRIAAHTGFGKHPHQDMEIVTIVQSGTISHEDTMGNITRIPAGDVQRMSAGTGLMHSEENKDDEEVHMYQIWVLPDTDGRTPDYEQKTFAPDKNALQLVVSEKRAADAVGIGSDVEIYQADYDTDTTETFEVAEGRGAFIYVTTGEIALAHGEKLHTKDQLRHTEAGPLELHIKAGTKFVLIGVKL